MYKSFKKHCLILLTAVLAVMLILACVFMLAPKTAAHADTEEMHDHSTMIELANFASIEIGNGTWYLGEDTNGDIIIHENTEATLCLNGCTLTGSGTGSVITVNAGAKLTLCDCQGTGCITGGIGDEFTVAGNTRKCGGGVLVNEGTFIMQGGTISGNNAYHGGGVYVYGGTVKMTGGTISSNTTQNGGGGVYVFSGGKFNVSGSPNVTGNATTDNSVNNLQLASVNATIEVEGPLEDGAQIGVCGGNSSNGWIGSGYTQDGKPSKYFIPDDPDNCVYVNAGYDDIYIRPHTFEEEFTVDTPATCTEAGSKSKHCTNCDGKTEVTEIAIIPHTFEEEFTVDTPATCTEVGSKSKHCTNCNEKTEVTEIPATGHTLAHNEEVAATEEKEGNSEYWSCNKCGKYFSDEAGETEITDKSSVTLPKITPSTSTPEKPSAPAEEEQSYLWLCWLLIPLAIGGGGVTLGIWAYKDFKKNYGNVNK